MDFPLKLGTKAVVQGKDELRQCILILLKEESGAFLQHKSLGGRVSIHNSDNDLLEENLRSTLVQLNGLSVVSVDVKGEDVVAVVMYKDNVIDFKFNLLELYNAEQEPN